MVDAAMNGTANGTSTADSHATSPSTDRDIRALAKGARAASRTLQSLDVKVRQKILHLFADALADEKNQQQILAANKQDTDAADKSDMTSSMKARLVLNEKKLKSCIDGCRQLADGPDPIGKLIRRTQLADGVELQQITVPLGVLLIIFEARPEVLPQLVALGVESGNGLLLKGGKETTNSLNALYALAKEAITTGSDGEVKGEELIVLLSGRSEVDQLLELDDVIDLVIPRGSNSLVSYIQNHTKIPVMGHAEGICHVYVDSAADISKAKSLVVDSKTDYPAACNAMETLLLHRSLVETKSGKKAPARDILDALEEAGVKLHGGPKAAKQLNLPQVKDLHHEYSDMECTVEMVDSVDDAVNHIHNYGSSHTELIVTEDKKVAQQFMRKIDSACVFVNTSTRFADGFRFGLGAEVGISTGRLHARGPVGVDGITTTKWIIVSTTEDGDTAKQYTDGSKKWVHKSLPIEQSKEFTHLNV